MDIYQVKEAEENFLEEEKEERRTPQIKWENVNAVEVRISYSAEGSKGEGRKWGWLGKWVWLGKVGRVHGRIGRGRFWRQGESLDKEAELRRMRI